MRTRLITTLILGLLYLVVGNPAYAQSEEDAKRCDIFLVECAEAMAEADLRLEECSELRNCRRECRVEKGECKIEDMVARDACLANCRSGRCKRECRRAFRTAKKECRSDKRSCISECKTEFQTAECSAAQKKNWQQIFASSKSCTAYDDCIERLQREENK